MRRFTLGDGSVRLSIEERFIELAVGEALRWEVERDTLASALDGLVVQLSSPEGYCHLELFDDAIRCDYAARGGAHGRCDFRIDELRTVLTAFSEPFLGLG